MDTNRYVRALLLDFDGTVADTHALIFQCFSETFRHHVGRECSRLLWEESVGLPLEEMFAAALQHVGESAPSPGRFARSYRERLAEIDGAVRAFPEMPETLVSLRQAGIRLALVTSKHEPAVSRHLARLELAHLFDAIITGDQCARSKPDPEPFARALAALGIPAGETAAVGDSQYDIFGARAAGVVAVAACWGTTHRAALAAAAPDLVLEHPRDLSCFLSPARSIPSAGESPCVSP